MIFPQFIMYVLIYDYLKFRTDPSITSQEIANYISVALAVALSVYETELAPYRLALTLLTQDFAILINMTMKFGNNISEEHIIRCVFDDT